jgi:hypothetical protein
LNSQPLLIDNYVYLLFRTWYIASWSCTSTECAVIVSVGLFDTSMNRRVSSAVLVVVVSYCWVGRISIGGCTTTDLPCSCCTIKNYHTASSVQFLLLWYHNIVGLAGVESAWEDAPPLIIMQLLHHQKFSHSKQCAVLVVVVSYCWVDRRRRISMHACAKRGCTMDLPCRCCTIKNSHTASAAQFLRMYHIFC